MCCFQDFMGKSDPYLEFSREMPDGKLQVVHRTEVLRQLCTMYHNQQKNLISVIHTVC